MLYAHEKEDNRRQKEEARQEKREWELAARSFFVIYEERCGEILLVQKICFDNIEEINKWLSNSAKNQNITPLFIFYGDEYQIEDTPKTIIERSVGKKIIL